VQVAEGSIEVFGKRVKKDEKIVVKKYRAIPIETSLKCAVVNLVKGHEGRVEKRKRIGCEMWKQLAERIRTE
ncbi:MAG: hypothetical protein GTO54_10545, partial [Nitrososphaeria archaeon]|nr:hypothetical protein [Nitrososphaeria archaeon]